ncbi:ABC transporter permease [Cyclobacterium marinum]|uniref:ABC transporter permease n=1 Tax=Cyclobacterium marinum TaxID=104 RepID=UPI0011EE4400|nr:FtsX-like permease family protein [Cyclobacterium marinum]MBI0397671.1 FtsX-like permease family protein [Cyclobacterium marinum]
MKLALILAYKNLIGSGLRTWLNVGILAFTFILILFYNGLLDGWNNQAKRASIEWEYGYGELRAANYDPYDPFSIQDGHQSYQPEEFKMLTPILIRQASIYPNGRMLSISLKGIPNDQKLLKLPTSFLSPEQAKIPVIIGKRMAATAHLEEGDEVLLRWRDKHGTFDALEVTIVKIFDSDVGSIDSGQMWIALAQLQEMTGLKDRASYFVANSNYSHQKRNGWRFFPQETLLEDINKLIASKKISGSIMYLLLLTIALLAIFDTQVLSVFRRQKEIGTYIALGMTRMQVVGLFTVEGSMYSLLAMLMGALIGIPILSVLAINGISFPEVTQGMGVTMAERIFPVFSLQLIAGTMILLIISATIVSFLPAKKIANMNPVEALKGKLQ